MFKVIKADATYFQPPVQTGRGRKAKYPFRYLEVGDHFIANSDDLLNLQQTITKGRVFGREHTIERSYEPFTLKVTRIT